MKKAFAIFSAALIFLGSMSNAVLFVSFKLNQPEIEQKYCVNKAKPQKQCRGKCHLTKQLVENNRQSDGATPRNIFEEGFKFHLFHQPLASLSPATHIRCNETHRTDCEATKSRLFGSSPFQPPDPQAV